jgi:lipopolysaccharide transport system permease protein
VPENLRPFYALNPMTGVIQSYRAILLEGTAPPESLMVSALVALVLLIGGYAFFKRLEYLFADII